MHTRLPPKLLDKRLNMLDKNKKLYVFSLLVFTVITLAFRPGIWLTNKPASSSNPYYVKGWEEGCTSGTNSYSLLYAPLMAKPFVKDLEVISGLGNEKDKDAISTAKDFYKSGWNEGFTLCRFYQSSVYELMQFAILIATLLLIGYLLARRSDK